MRVRGLSPLFSWQLYRNGLQGIVWVEEWSCPCVTGSPSLSNDVTGIMVRAMYHALLRRA
jgi:hypothetical protein